MTRRTPSANFCKLMRNSSWGNSDLIGTKRELIGSGVGKQWNISVNCFMTLISQWARKHEFHLEKISDWTIPSGHWQHKVLISEWTCVLGRLRGNTRPLVPSPTLHHPPPAPHTCLAGLTSTCEEACVEKEGGNPELHLLTLLACDKI